MNTFETFETQKMPILSKVLGIFIFITFALSGYVFWQEQQISATIEKNKNNLSQQIAKIDDLLKKEKIEEKNQAKTIWEKISKNQILWSKWVREILETIEKTGKVEFTALKADKNLSFIASGTAEDLKSIARLILVIDKHDNFQNPFVVNLSQDEATRKFSFTLTFDAQN